MNPPPSARTRPVVREGRTGFPWHWTLAPLLFLHPTLALHGAEHAVTSTVCVVLGAPGAKEYEEAFAQWHQTWADTCQQAEARYLPIGVGPATEASDRDQLQVLLQQEPKDGPAPFWVVLLGHGTSDGKMAKFNLRGPDLTAEDLKAWLAPFQRPLVIVHGASSGSPFLSALSASNRVVLTATRSAFEQNYARFGGAFTQAVGSPAADLDQDGQTSVLEAFLMASRSVAEFYEGEGRLVTEHALLDDNGDGRGTPPDWFKGTRAVRKSSEPAVPDGLRAHQIHLIPSPAEKFMPPEIRARRDALELELVRLREEKPKLTEAAYLALLEPLLLELARLYQGGKTEPVSF